MSAMGLKLFRLVFVGDLGTGMMMADFRPAAMVALFRDSLINLVRI